MGLERAALPVGRQGSITLAPRAPSIARVSTGTPFKTPNFYPSFESRPSVSKVFQTSKSGNNPMETKPSLKGLLSLPHHKVNIGSEIVNRSIQPGLVTKFTRPEIVFFQRESRVGNLESSRRDRVADVIRSFETKQVGLNPLQESRIKPSKTSLTTGGNLESRANDQNTVVNSGESKALQLTETRPAVEIKEKPVRRQEITEGVLFGKQNISTVTPEAKAEVIRVENAMKVLQNLQVKTPELDQEVRNITKAAVISLAIDRKGINGTKEIEKTKGVKEAKGEEVKKIEARSIKEKVKTVVQTMKAKIRTIIRVESNRKKLEDIEAEDFIAEEDPEALDSRFKLAAKTLESVTKDNITKQIDTVSVAEVASKMPTEFQTHRSVSSEPLKKSLVLLDGSYSENKQDMGVDTEQIDPETAWRRIVRIIGSKPPVRFRRVVTTRRAADEDVKRVFNGREDLEKMVDLI